MRPLVIIDTNVWIAALKSKRGASFKLISLIDTGVFDLAISVPLVLEYEEQIRRFYPNASDLVDYICSVGKPFRIYYLWRPILRDPDDELILELAVASQADCIVTFNKKDFQKVKNLKLFTPKEFLDLWAL